MSKTDFEALYKLQDKFLIFFSELKLPFYLTGGTALSRFYLNHRYSDDLDFFVNKHPDFSTIIEDFSQQLYTHFQVVHHHTLKLPDYARFYIQDSQTLLKLDFVNDVEYHGDKLRAGIFGKIDSPLDILANKLTAILNRDEPKDIYDIINISLNYKFNWEVVFYNSKRKALINEIDVEQRINTFPIELFNDLTWTIKPIEKELYSTYLAQISSDFIQAADNSLCKNGTPIEQAQINFTR
jgi:predicted nucleotidyltransferase component of viral defense system